MSVHFERGMLLLRQNRHAQAAEEFGRALAENPEDTFAHANLAQCHIALGRFEEAESEARAAVRLAADESYSHYMLGRVLQSRGRLKEAEAAAQETLRLEPDDPSNHSLLASILLDRKSNQDALAATEAGLAYDPNHADCSALRTIALTRLGRADDALDQTAGALRANPEDDMAHAGRGWALLRDRRPREALPHFREALRLDSTSEYARSGMIEALKARYWIYRQVLVYLMWASHLSLGRQLLLCAGIFAVQRVVGNLTASNHPLQPLAVIAFGLLLCFYMLALVGEQLFNLTLLANPFGRQALRRDEKIGAAIIGLFVLAIAAALAVNYFTSRFADLYALVVALCLGLVLLPVSTIFNSSPGRFRRLMVAASVIAAILATVELYLQGRYVRQASAARTQIERDLLAPLLKLKAPDSKVRTIEELEADSSFAGSNWRDKIMLLFEEKTVAKKLPDMPAFLNAMIRFKEIGDLKRTAWVWFEVLKYFCLVVLLAWMFLEDYINRR